MLFNVKDTTHTLLSELTDTGQVMELTLTHEDWWKRGRIDMKLTLFTRIVEMSKLRGNGAMVSDFWISPRMRTLATGFVFYTMLLAQYHPSPATHTHAHTKKNRTTVKLKEEKTLNILNFALSCVVSGVEEV
jgi:hypothetical protein